MESLGFLQINSPLGGSQVETDAELRIHQKHFLYNRGKDTRYNQSVIPLDNFNLSSILQNYGNRNGTMNVTVYMH